MSYFRENIEKLAAYVPGEQPAAGERVIKLNTNENPYPPSPAAMKVLRSLDGDLLRRYPNPMAQKFRRAVAGVLGFDQEWILVGNGSDELLSMIMRAVVEPGGRVVYPMPTYVLYRTLAQIQAAEPVEIPYDDDYNLPLEQLAAPGGALTLVCTPNSPSGTLAPNAELSKLAGRLRGVLVIDEAYVDFADGNALELVRRHGNVIVLRTLSKGYSLAGLRLGFAVARPELIAGLAKVKDSYNVDAVACAVGAAAFEDQAYMVANAEKVKASRARLTEELKRLGFKFWPSQSNFILARPPACGEPGRTEGNAERIYLNLKAGGILVRYFKEPRLDDKLRISVGTDEQNAALLAALREGIGHRVD
jgi:histidinol-phosphate aminotransferase